MCRSAVVRSPRRTAMVAASSRGRGRRGRWRRRSALHRAGLIAQRESSRAISMAQTGVYCSRSSREGEVGDGALVGPPWSGQVEAAFCYGLGEVHLGEEAVGFVVDGCRGVLLEEGSSAGWRDQPATRRARSTFSSNRSGWLGYCLTSRRAASVIWGGGVGAARGRQGWG